MTRAIQCMSVFLLISLSACNPKTRTKEATQPAGESGGDITTVNNVTMGKVFFEATGNEPSWSLSLTESEIRFTSMIEGYETISAPLPEMNRAADANVKRYRAVTESTEIIAVISATDCSDTMSDTSFGYKVSINLKNKTDTDSREFKGCGNYLTDVRLNDIWVLERIDTTAVSISNYTKELPNLEIDSRENRLTGFTGCNRMNGAIFNEEKLLRFTNIATTRRACPDMNKETEFLSALKAVTAYEIKNNRLWLSNPEKLLLVFKKAD